jgi:hypothetical protein
METGGSEDITFDMDISFRGCVAGEAFSEIGKCVTCETGTYSVEVFEEPGTCKECPTDKAECTTANGTNTIGPKYGYWRSSAASDNFIPCLFTAACLGTQPGSTNPKGDCFNGYQGILCADC